MYRNPYANESRFFFGAPFLGGVLGGLLGGALLYPFYARPYPFYPPYPFFPGYAPFYGSPYFY
ncbi:MAG TPA: hypothetical protein VEV44_05505 [Pseudoneobacillus sp.]|nr:hypothetical protein [Pseudoneobacillus sp.]